MISENTAHISHIDEEVETMLLQFERRKLKEYHMIIAEDDGVPDLTKKLT